VKQLTRSQAKKRLTEAKQKLSMVCYYTDGSKMTPAQYRSFLDECTKCMKLIETIRNKLT